MDADAYRAHLSALLPTGLPWPREPEAVLQRLLRGWADGLARADARALDLVAESDPRSTTEMVGDWERVLGLPDTCLGSSTSSPLALRRAAIAAKLAFHGSQTPSWYVAVAATLGHTATLTEYRAQTVGDDVDSTVRDAAWAYTWGLQLTDVETYPLRVDDRVDAAFEEWEPDESLECLIERTRPAHTTVIIGYGD